MRLAKKLSLNDFILDNPQSLPDVYHHELDNMIMMIIIIGAEQDVL